jgi:hypothetical protein
MNESEEREGATDIINRQAYFLCLYLPMYSLGFAQGNINNMPA